MKLLQFLASYAGALAGGFLGLVGVMIFGLVVHEAVIMPLALVIGALLAALGAVWAARLTGGAGERPSLLPTVGIVELASIVLVPMIYVLFIRPAFRGPPIYLIAAVALFLALISAIAALSLPRPRTSSLRERRLTLGLLLLAVLSVLVVMLAASLFGLTGA